jgi:hypothetical protein
MPWPDFQRAWGIAEKWALTIFHCPPCLMKTKVVRPWMDRTLPSFVTPVALVESVGELLCQGLEFIHAHGCVSSDLVGHTPRHTVTELYRRICAPQGHWPESARAPE